MRRAGAALDALASGERAQAPAASVTRGSVIKAPTFPTPREMASAQPVPADVANLHKSAISSRALYENTGLIWRLHPDPPLTSDDREKPTFEEVLSQEKWRYLKSAVHQMLRTPRKLTAAERITFTADAAAGRPVEWSDEDEEDSEKEEEPASVPYEDVDDISSGVSRIWYLAS